MKENVKTVETNIVKEILQLLNEIAQGMKTVLWDNDVSENEAEELTGELLKTIQEVNEEAAKLNQVEENSKEENKFKGLRGEVKVEKAPSIPTVEFDSDKKQEKADIEISE